MQIHWQGITIICSW